MSTITLTSCPFCDVPAEDPCNTDCPDLISWRNPQASLEDTYRLITATRARGWRRLQAAYLWMRVAPVTTHYQVPRLVATLVEIAS